MRTALLAAGVLALTACTSNTAPSGGAIAVESADDACDIAAAEAPSGTVQFNVQNTGSQVTEFYVLAEDGLQILSEVENIGPGLSRDLVVQLQPGKVVLACKPGMVGDGIRSDFVVVDSGNGTGVAEEDATVIDAATTNYAAYVKD